MWWSERSGVRLVGWGHRLLIFMNVSQANFVLSKDRLTDGSATHASPKSASGVAFFGFTILKLISNMEKDSDGQASLLGTRTRQ